MTANAPTVTAALASTTGEHDRDHTRLIISRYANCIPRGDPEGPSPSSLLREWDVVIHAHLFSPPGGEPQAGSFRRELRQARLLAGRVGHRYGCRHAGGDARPPRPAHAGPRLAQSGRDRGRGARSLRRDLRSGVSLRTLRGSVDRLADALLQPPPLGLDRGPALPAHRPHRRAPHHRLPGRGGDRAPPAAASAVGLPQPGRLRLPALRARLVGAYSPVPVGAGPRDVRPAGVVRGEPGRAGARLCTGDRGRA